MEKSDEEIMRDWEEGDGQAMAAIFNRYKSRIFSFCQRMIKNRAQAEDAASEVFLALFINKYEYDPSVKFSTWIYTIARNKCMNHFRKKQTVSLSMSEEDSQREWDLPDGRPLPREQASRDETAVYLKQAIDRLPSDQQEAIILQHYEGLSYEQISLVLECSLDNVKVIIFRAKERLRVELSAFVKEEER